MKERSIILSGDEVRGVIVGSMTQLRRPVSEKLWPLLDQIAAYNGKPTWQCLDFDVRCPWDVERFWGKETWRVGAWLIEDGMIAVDYRADGFSRLGWLSVPDEDQFDRLVKQSCYDAEAGGFRLGCDENYTWEPGYSPCRWRPSTAMPRWASRLTLDNTGVTVELNFSRWDWVIGIRRLR